MVLKDLPEYLSTVPAVNQFPNSSLWSSYDEGADVLYVRFRESNKATDNELTDDDIIITAFLTSRIIPWLRRRQVWP